MKKFILTLTKAVCLTSLVLSLGILGIKSYGYHKADESIKKVQSIKQSDNTTSNNALLDVNEDFKFWIKIDNTKVDYPVVQGEDNDFYLYNDFYKSKSSSGSIFMDFKVNNESKNTVIYGHNMKNGSMFADVELFKDEKFFNENKFITIEKGNKEYVYEIFSVYYLSGENTDYLQCNFSSDEEFDNFIHHMKERSLFESNKELDNNDIITLSTCSYEGNNFRTTVHAQLIEVN